MSSDNNLGFFNLAVKISMRNKSSKSWLELLDFHQRNQACKFSFSHNSNRWFSPFLKNCFKERTSRASRFHLEFLGKDAILFGDNSCVFVSKSIDFKKISRAKEKLEQLPYESKAWPIADRTIGDLFFAIARWSPIFICKKDRKVSRSRNLRIAILQSRDLQLK